MVVTTMPGFKIPIHFSYIIYLAGFSRMADVQYFRSALRLCRWTGTAPSLLLHPLDFLGGDDAGALSFFPGMRMAGAPKLELMAELMSVVLDHFSVVSMQEHARLAMQNGNLATVGLKVAP